MSDISNGEAGSSANNNDPESNQNKKDSEKKRREKENICIEELAMLISSKLPEFSDSDDSSCANDPSKLEKGSILQETVEKLKKLKAGNQARMKEIQQGEISSSQSVLPKEILGSLVLEALDGFMFIVSNDGKIDFVSDNVFYYLGFKQDNLIEQVIYNFIHLGDHARFSVNLEPESWRTWKRLPTNAAVTQGFDRSKVFNVRFLVNNVAKQESMEDHQQRVDQYENMQVSAIVMLNPIEDKGEDPKSGLFCIARRITHNERSGLTPVEQFTTKSSRTTFKIETVDTEGLPELYRKNISGHALGKTLVDLVHPHDKPLIKEHIEGFLKNITDTSRVYRMVLPPPQNVVHVKSKTKDFRPQPGSSHPGYIMSTHAIIRENELQLEDLPALRPELRGIENAELPQQIPHQMSLAGPRNPSVTSPQVQNPLIQRSPDIIQTEPTGSRVILSTNSGRGYNPQQKMTSPLPVSSPNPVMSPYSGDANMKSDMFHQLLSPSSQSENMSSRQAYSPQSMQKMSSQQSPANGGNELLKELLKPKESESKSRDSDGSCYKSPSQRQSSSQGENVTLLQLLNEKNNTDHKEPLETSELLKQLRRPPETLGRISELAQLLQNSPGSSLHPELKRSSSNYEGPAAKKVPSLEKLLSVPPDRTIPPPVPRKWSEMPQDKLPRDIVIDRLRESTSRNNNATQVRSPNARSPGSYASSTPPSAKTTTTNIPQMGSQQRTIIRNTSRSNSSSDANKQLVNDNLLPHFSDIGDATDFNDLIADPYLSKILDTVIGLADDNDNNSDQNLAKQKIHEIEQSLKSVEHSFAPTHNQPSLTMVQTTTNSSRVMVSSGGVISHGQQQQLYTGPGVIRPGVPQHRILQQRPSGNPVTFQPTGPRSPSIQGTNMEELLKGIPPNVAIKTISDQQSGAGMRSALERQLSSPTPARHLSGDSNLQGNVANFNRSGRHASGDQIQVLGPPSRRSSGDSSLQRFGLQTGGHPGHGDQQQIQGSYTIMPEISQQSIIRTSAGNTIMTSQNIRQGRVVGRGGPGGRALSQEDLEAFGLSVEVSNDFRPPSQTGQYTNKPSPQFSPIGNSSMNPFSPQVQQMGQFKQGGGQQNKQFSPVGNQQSGQFQPQGGKPANQFSPVGAGPGGQYSPIVSQVSQFGKNQQQQVVHISQAETQFNPPAGLQNTQFSPVGGRNGPQVSQYSPINNQQVSPFNPQFSPSNPSSHFNSKPGAYNPGSQPGRPGM